MVIVVLILSKVDASMIILLAIVLYHILLYSCIDVMKESDVMTVGHW